MFRGAGGVFRKLCAAVRCLGLPGNHASAARYCDSAVVRSAVPGLGGVSLLALVSKGWR